MVCTGRGQRRRPRRACPILLDPHAADNVGYRHHSQFLHILFTQTLRARLLHLVSEQLRDQRKSTVRLLVPTIFLYDFLHDSPSPVPRTRNYATCHCEKQASIKRYDPRPPDAGLAARSQFLHNSFTKLSHKCRSIVLTMVPIRDSVVTQAK